MIQWDPNPIFWTVPIINLPIAWYGVIFAVGFFVGYMVMVRLVERVVGERKLAVRYTDKLLVLCVIGTLVGARLGHVFFYDWPIYRENLWAILNIREGGLASHGAAIGVFLSMVVFQLRIGKKFGISFWRLFDMIVIPTILIGAFIRIGNFVNQELVGTETSMPWGVIFGHALGGESAVARHPVQLYESLVYFAIFGALLFSYRRLSKWEGMNAGLFFILVFSARFVLEFFKEHQSASVSSDALLSMGQWLSIPFVLAGVAMLFWRRSRPVTE